MTTARKSAYVGAYSQDDADDLWYPVTPEAVREAIRANVQYGSAEERNRTCRKHLAAGECIRDGRGGYIRRR